MIPMVSAADAERVKTRLQTLVQTEAWSSVALTQRMHIGLAAGYGPFLGGDIEWSDATAPTAPANEGGVQVQTKAREAYASLLPMVESMFAGAGEPSFEQISILDCTEPGCGYVGII